MTLKQEKMDFKKVITAWRDFKQRGVAEAADEREGREKDENYSGRALRAGGKTRIIYSRVQGKCKVDGHNAIPVEEAEFAISLPNTSREGRAPPPPPPRSIITGLHLLHDFTQNGGIVLLFSPRSFALIFPAPRLSRGVLLLSLRPGAPARGRHRSSI